MKKSVIIGIVISVVIVVIILGLIAHSYSQVSVTFEDAQLSSIEFAPISWSNLIQLGLEAFAGNWLGAAFEIINALNVDFIFELKNNGLFPVYIPEISYDLEINEISIGKGTSMLDITINPGETRQITVLQNFQKSGLSPAVSSIVDSEGIMNINVRGTAYFVLLSLEIPVPFEESRQVSLIDEIHARLHDIERN